MFFETWEIDFRDMTLSVLLQAPQLEESETTFLVRRTSPTGWEKKIHPTFRKERIAELKELLATDPKESVAEAQHEDELAALEREPEWGPVPEEHVASIETKYQRYLAAR